jgi:hypothetical protein
MLTAVIAIVVVIALIAGLVLSLRKSAKTGMPSQDVLRRATERAKKEDSGD